MNRELMYIDHWAYVVFRLVIAEEGMKVNEL